MITWHFITHSAYNLMSNSLKTSDKLFFIKDDKSILNGIDVFNEDIILYNRYPTTIISDKVYININTLEGMICTGTNWTTIINPVIVNRNDFLDSDEIKSIHYDAQYNNLVVIKIDDTEDTIELSDFTLDLNYSNNAFSIINEDCHLSYGRKIVLSDFIDRFAYDGNGNLDIIFKGSNNSLRIVTNNLLNKGGNINFTITGNSFIAECLLYDNNTNEMNSTNGIYTVYRNSTGISTDVTTATISYITNHLATIVDANTSLMTTVGFDKTGQIILADDEGNAKASGVKITEKVAEVPTDRFVVTEKGIADYIKDTVVVKSEITPYEKFKVLTSDTASDKRIASERTLFEQACWKII